MPKGYRRVQRNKNNSQSLSALCAPLCPLSPSSLTQRIGGVLSLVLSQIHARLTEELQLLTSAWAVFFFFFRVVTYEALQDPAESSAQSNIRRQPLSPIDQDRSSGQLLSKLRPPRSAAGSCRACRSRNTPGDNQHRSIRTAVLSNFDRNSLVQQSPAGCRRACRSETNPPPTSHEQSIRPEVLSNFDRSPRRHRASPAGSRRARCSETRQVLEAMLVLGKNEGSEVGENSTFCD